MSSEERKALIQAINMKLAVLDTYQLKTVHSLAGNLIELEKHWIPMYHKIWEAEKETEETCSYPYKKNFKDKNICERCPDFHVCKFKKSTSKTEKDCNECPQAEEVASGLFCNYKGMTVNPPQECDIDTVTGKN